VAAGAVSCSIISTTRLIVSGGSGLRPGGLVASLQKSVDPRRNIASAPAPHRRHALVDRLRTATAPIPSPDNPQSAPATPPSASLSRSPGAYGCVRSCPLLQPRIFSSSWESSDEIATLVPPFRRDPPTDDHRRPEKMQGRPEDTARSARIYDSLIWAIGQPVPGFDPYIG
jgi:hypothetical protein